MDIVKVHVTLSQSNIDAIKRVDQNGLLDLSEDIEAAQVLECIVSDISNRSNGTLRKEHQVTV